ncbi:hypothetical protein ED733_003110 [Metarhizium rileyi]|uniref:Uncharacterized protein n=1 Tax=Metarhizium rileyi (strain RCEF 4871) TaxID=1649241 RepID=A0A5C6G261_METRR|nr:hypothetical protein ED733_003110 [Metarhizium rileyi]
MPITALSTKWTLGENRPEDPRHVQRLKKRFLDEGGPKREAKGNHIVALCSGADVRRMLESIGLGETDFNAIEAMPDFSDWMLINGGRKAELVEGQHRIRALPEFAEEVGWGEEEMWWPCEFYDRDTISYEQNLHLRVNRKVVAQADSHGDIWRQAVAAESQNPGVFHGNQEDMMDQMAHILRLYDESGVPLRRLVTLWRNERWRAMITKWCSTTVGRATFRISTWEWMISCRIDDFWFSAFRHTLLTLAGLPGDADRYVGLGDWKKMSGSLTTGRSEEQVRMLFYPDKTSQQVSESSRRSPDFLAALDNRSYWDLYEYILEHPETRFPDAHRLTSLSEVDGRILPRVMEHVVDWLGDDDRTEKSAKGNNKNKGPNRRDNNKPPLRNELTLALGHFNQKLVRQAKRRVGLLLPENGPELSSASTASILMQQEILEFVYSRLAEFKSPSIKADLAERLAGDNEEQYRGRFLKAEWAGVLGIVRRYMEAEFRPEWVTSKENDQPEDGRGEEEEEEEAFNQD